MMKDSLAARAEEAEAHFQPALDAQHPCPPAFWSLGNHCLSLPPFIAVTTALGGQGAQYDQER